MASAPGGASWPAARADMPRWPRPRPPSKRLRSYACGIPPRTYIEMPKHSCVGGRMTLHPTAVRRAHLLLAGAVVVAGAAAMLGSRSTTPAEVRGAPLDVAAARDP